jgi:hypothetical protein
MVSFKKGANMKSFNEWLEDKENNFGFGGDGVEIGKSRKPRPGDMPADYYKKRSTDRIDAFNQAIKAQDWPRIKLDFRQEHGREPTDEELAKLGGVILDNPEAEEDTFKFKSLYQISLGELVKDLNNLPRGTMVDKLSYPHNYVDEPWDVAFEREVGKMPAEELINICNSLINAGRISEQYKIDEKSFVWIVVDQGEPGHKLLDVKPDGTFEVSWPHDDHWYP